MNRNEKTQLEETQAEASVIPSPAVPGAGPLFLARWLTVAGAAIAGVAHASGGQIGGGLIAYATPIILFLGLGAVIVALVSSVIRPDLVKTAAWTAVILVIIFFVLRNSAALQSAVQAG